MNANNNTYSCIRTINQTHNFLYCEFTTGLITYYNLRMDPFETQNRFSSLSADERKQMHNTLEHLKGCRGRSCTIPRFGASNEPILPILSPQTRGIKRKYDPLGKTKLVVIELSKNKKFFFFKYQIVCCRPSKRQREERVPSELKKIIGNLILIHISAFFSWKRKQLQHQQKQQAENRMRNLNQHQSKQQHSSQHNNQQHNHKNHKRNPSHSAETHLKRNNRSHRRSSWIDERDLYL